MNIKSFVFLDFETTGLPAFECNKTKITELCLISVEAEHLVLGVTPRVQNKLNLCFNPWKRIQPEAENITGLSNDLLENQSSFNDVTLNLLINFLERLQKPVCFVAHNGLSFDYPILKNHVENMKIQFPNNILCIDSLRAFRSLLIESKPDHTTAIVKTIASTSSITDELSDDWDAELLKEVLRVERSIDKDWQKINETTPIKKNCDNAVLLRVEKIKRTKILSENDAIDFSKKPSARKKLNFSPRLKAQSFKLTDIYERLLQKTPENAHHAEADVKMMLECAVHIGERFVEWANNNATPFDQIPTMKPGTSIVFKDI